MAAIPTSIQGPSGYPDHFINPKLKNGEWCLKYIKQMYYDFNGGWGNANIFNRKSSYTINRLYADGRQDIEQYKPFIINPKTKDKSLVNIDWSIMSVMPKFVNIILGRKEKEDHYVYATAIDPASVEDRIKRKNQLRNLMRAKGTLLKVEEITRNKFFQELQDLPDTNEEFELYWAANYKNELEVQMENAIEFILFRNKWKEIKKELYLDLLCCGEASVRDYTDPFGRIKTRRVIPENLIYSFTNNPDFREVQHAGEIIRVSLVELRDMLNGVELTEAQWNSIRSLAAQSTENMRSYTYDYFYNNSRYDSILHVDIVDAEWLSIDRIKFENRITKYGNNIVSVTDFNNTKETETRSTFGADLKVVYKGKWIIGSDIVFDYGRAENSVWNPERYQGGKISFHIYKPKVFGMSNRPVIDQLRPIANQIQNLWLKLQAAIAKARPKGVSIEVTSLMDVLPNMKPLEVLSMYDESGNLLWKADPNNPGYNFKPIEELENGLPRDIMNFINLINQYIEWARQIIGVNEVVDGTTPKSEALVGVQKLAIESSNNATQFLDGAYESIFNDMCESLSIRIQDVARRKKMKFLIPAIGDRLETLVEIGEEISVPDFGIMIEAKPTAEQRERLEQAMMVAMQEGSIDLGDMLQIRRFRNVKQAELYLSAVRRRNQKMAAAQAQQNAQANAQQQQASLAMKAQLDAQTEQMKHQFEMEKLQLQYSLMMELEKIKAELKHGSDITNRILDQEEKDDDFQARLAEKSVDHEMQKEMMKAQAGQQMGGMQRQATKPKVEMEMEDEEPEAEIPETED